MISRSYILLTNLIVTRAVSATAEFLVMISTIYCVYMQQTQATIS